MVQSFLPIRRIWEWLISPIEPVEESDRLHQRRLLAGVLFSLLLAGLFYLVFSIRFNYYNGLTNLLISLMGLLPLAIAYLLNRLGKFTTAVWMTIWSTSVIFFLMTFQTDGVPVDLDFLNFLFFPLLIASLFLVEIWILVLSGLYMSAIGITAIGVFGYDPITVIGGPVFFTLIAGGLIFLITWRRNDLELTRRRILAEKEERYRTLFETSYEGICIIAGDRILDANPSFARMFGLPLREMVGAEYQRFIPLILSAAPQPAGINQNGFFPRIQVTRSTGRPFYIEVTTHPQVYRGEQAIVLAARDITEKVLAEEAQEYSDRLFRTLFDQANDAIFLLDLDNTHIRANTKAAEMLGYANNELIGKPISEIVVQREYPDAMNVKRDLIEGKELSLYERVFRRKDGSEFPVEINVTLVRDRDGYPEYIQSIVRDISERKRKDVRLQKQLEHLQALRKIDLAISAGSRLEDTLKEVLRHVVEQLVLDAAIIYLRKPGLNGLEYLAQRGLPQNGAWTHLVPLADPLAGVAAEEFHLAWMDDLSAAGSPRLTSLAAEGLRCGFALPLIAKGQVRGVLEVFLRQPFEPSSDWLDFLITLAGQTAIALDNGELFQDLQRSNEELVQAIDGTLEGWAKALEMRDKETEGHMRRVTQMSVDLGRMMRLSAEDLVHLRRGALLHDIGKMGVPDAILLKPGKLNEEEWAIMKQHPVMAYEWIASISFLQQAADIPHYHHERWDGSGYPEGLKGKAIPLGARIFAAVDVWDALLSHRPYKDPWPKEKAKAFFIDNAGVLFDPQVIDALLRLVDEA